VVCFCHYYCIIENNHFGSCPSVPAWLACGSCLLKISCLKSPPRVTPSTTTTTTTTTVLVHPGFMVLRKSPPPRLENISNKWNNPRSEPRSTSSPASSLPSPEQLARLNRIPSQDSVYSPDLNTSPAFDLMPLEEAQKSPVGSPTSHAQSPGPDGIQERAAQDRPVSAEERASDGSGYLVPAVLCAGPQSGPTADECRRSAPETSNGVPPVQLQSNNPFLKPRTSQPSQYMTDESQRDSHTTSSSRPLSQCTLMRPHILEMPDTNIFFSRRLYSHDRTAVSLG
jgi:hypothetical protein